MARRPPASVEADDPENVWREKARTMLRVEQRRQNLTYADIAERMQAAGINETEVSVRNKISRGTFPATFMLQFMHVLGLDLIPFKPHITGEFTLPPELLAQVQSVKIAPAALLRALTETAKKE